MHGSFEAVFFNPLYEGDAIAAFPEFPLEQVEQGYAYWSHTFYQSLGWFYRAQLRQHSELVGRAFAQDHQWPLDEPIPSGWEDEFNHFANQQGLMIHEARMRQAQQELEFFQPKGQPSFLDFNKELHVYIEFITAVQEGRWHYRNMKPMLNEVWFNWQINPTKDLTRFLRSLPYDEYLHTEHWRRVRGAMLVINDGHCQSARCNGRDSYWLETHLLQVHHDSYANRGCERFNDLRLLCGDCHQLEHTAMQGGA